MLNGRELICLEARVGLYAAHEIFQDRDISAGILAIGGPSGEAINAH